MIHNTSKQSKILYTRFDEATAARLREMADADERTVAYLIRVAVNQYLNRRKAA